MEFVLILFIAILVFSFIAYLKVLYESLRNVKIAKIPVHAKKERKESKHFSEKFKKWGFNYFNSVEFEKLKQAPGPLPWPILGNLHLLSKFDVPFIGFSELAKKYGDIYTLTLGTTRCLIVNNLYSIREILNQNGKSFGGRPDFLRFHVLFGGDRNNSLALCDWSQLQQKRRNLARKHCSPRDSSLFFQKMSYVGCFEMDEFIKHLENIGGCKKEIHIKPLIQQACANMFCQYMCSIRFDYNDSEFQKIVNCFDEIFWEINQGYALDFLPWLSPFYTSHLKRIAYWSETIRSFILKRIVNDREKTIATDEEDKDFTDALLKSILENGSVSRDTIIFMLEDFIGGHSAIGNLVMLALAFIIRNPLTATKIQTEIDSVIKESTRAISLSDIDFMPYTVATLYEVLRNCSSPIVPHVATEDVAVAGFGVTKGTIVFINNYALNKSAKYWNDPEIFCPERFVEKISPPFICPKTKRLKCAQLKKNISYFLPFSIGKRTCIGQNLVKGFGFIMLANILNKYDVSCSDLKKIKIYPACVAVPPETFHLALTPRCKK